MFKPRHSIVLLYVLLFLTTGCIPIPYIYPNWNHLPAMSVETKDKVYVFREDDHHERGTILVTGWFGYGQNVDLVGVSDKGAIGEQSGFHWDHGVFWYPLYITSNKQTMTVRLYRPGFQLVQPSNWPFTEKVVWKRTSSLAEQEQVLDELWLGKDRKWTEEGSRFRMVGLTVSATARVFLADEYDRLADLEQARMSALSQSQKDRLPLQRLRSKATWLRETMQPAAKRDGPKTKG